MEYNQARLQDLLAQGMPPEELNALLSKSTMTSGGYQQQPQPYSNEGMGVAFDPSVPTYYGNEGRGVGVGRPDMQQPQPQQYPSRLSQSQLMAMRGDNTEPGVTYGGMPATEQLPQNYIRNNATGKVTNLDYAAAGGGGGSGRRQHDPFFDGPQVLKREQMDDGRIKEWRRVATTDGFGRQSATVQEYIVTPDYLNPAKIAELKYEKARAAATTPKESTYDKRMAEIRAEETAARQPGTLPYKRIQDDELAKRKESAKNENTLKAAESSKRYSESVASEVDVAIAALFNTTPDKLPELFGSESGMKKAEGQTEAATGSIDVYTPTFFQSTANVEERAKRLQSMAELMGLTNLRKAGVAPGSITEKEWPKFGAQLGNISLRMGDKEFAQEMARIWRTNQQLRGTGQMDLDDAMKDGGGGQAAAKVTTKAEVQATAKARGIPIAQVMADAQAKGYTIKD